MFRNFKFSNLQIRVSCKIYLGIYHVRTSFITIDVRCQGSTDNEQTFETDWEHSLTSVHGKLQIIQLAPLGKGMAGAVIWKKKADLI